MSRGLRGLGGSMEQQREKCPVLVQLAYHLYWLHHVVAAVADRQGKMGYRMNPRLIRALRLLALGLVMVAYCSWFAYTNPGPPEALAMGFKCFITFIVGGGVLLLTPLALGALLVHSADAYYWRTHQIPRLLALVEMLLRIDELRLWHPERPSVLMARRRVRLGLLLYAAACEDRARALGGAEKLREFAPDSWVQLIEERVRETRIGLSENARRIISDVVSEVRAGAQKPPSPAPDEQTQQL